MGKLALAQYRAKKEALPRRRPPGTPKPPHRSSRMVHFRINGRSRTRIIAALLHDVAPAVIARDQKVPQATVKAIACEEGLIKSNWWR